MESYPTDPLEPFSISDGTDMAATTCSGRWGALLRGGNKNSYGDNNTKKEALRQQQQQQQPYSQLSGATLGVGWGHLKWSYGSRRPGWSAYIAAAWALVSAICLTWHHLVSPIGLGRPLAVAALLIPIPVAMTIYGSEVAFGVRWILLTDDAVCFPRHRYTSATVEVALRELVSARLEPASTAGLPSAYCCCPGFLVGSGNMVLASGDGVEHRIPGNCLASQQDVLAVVQHIENAIQAAAVAQPQPTHIMAVCCD
jgi:hypothetical protein